MFVDCSLACEDSIVNYEDANSILRNRVRLERKLRFLSLAIGVEFVFAAEALGPPGESSANELKEHVVERSEELVELLENLL